MKDWTGIRVGVSPVTGRAGPRRERRWELSCGGCGSRIERLEKQLHEAVRCRRSPKCEACVNEDRRRYVAERKRLGAPLGGRKPFIASQASP
jgi:hypothetical protein